MSATTMNRRRYPGNEPSRRFVGWAVVVVVHVVILWALISGTARKGLEIVNKPLEAAVIQEVIIPPPPPPPPPPPRQIVKAPQPRAPKVAAPPPPFVPPPEVTPPVSAAPAIASVATPSPTPAVIAPAAPPAPPAPPGPPRPAAPGRGEMGIACPTQVKPDMPRRAIQDGTEGVVRAQALIRDGAVREVTILSGPRIFHSAVRNAMLQYKCVSEPGDVLAPQEFIFKIDN